MDDAEVAVVAAVVAGVNVDGVSAKVGDCGEWRPPCPCGLRKVSSCGMPPRGDSERLLPAVDDRLDSMPKSAGEGGGCSEFVVVVAVDRVEAVVVVVGCAR